MESKIIKCKICGNDFDWSADEQGFYSDRNLAEPKRCHDCRTKRRSDEETITRLQERIKELEGAEGCYCG